MRFARALLLSSLAVAMLLQGAAAGTAGLLELPAVRVIRSDNSGVVVRYAAGLPGLADDGLGRVQVTAPDADYPVTPGEYELPAKVVRVGLPQHGGFRTTVRLGPVHHFDDVEPTTGVGLSRTGDTPGATDGVRSVLEVGSVEELRGVRFVELTLHPCQYDRDARRLSVYEWLEVAVDFEAGPDGPPGRPGPPRRPVALSAAGAGGEAARIVGAARSGADPMDAVAAAMLVNGELAFDWKRPEVDRAGSFFDRSSHWLKLTIGRTGIHAVTGRELAEAGVPIVGVDPGTLALYTLGEHVLNGPYPDTMVPVALHVEGGEDGRLDPDDRVIFFARAADYWAGRCSAWVGNPYTGRTAYWLTWGLEPGLRIPIGLGPDTTGTQVVGTGRWRVHQEENQECPARSGLLWVWRTMLKDSYRSSVSLDVPLAVETPVRLTALSGRFFATTNGNELVLTLNGAVLETLRFNAAPATQPYRFEVDAVVPLMSRGNTLQLELRGDGTRRVLFDYIELDLIRRLSLGEGQCRFLQDDTGSFRFHVREAPGPAIVLDVTDPLRPMMADGVEYRDGAAVFSRRVGRPAEFCIADAGKLFSPETVELRRPGRLAAPGRAAEYWIVTPREFIPAATRLARYRAGNISWLPGARAEAAALDDIYDDFGYGIEEPGAIKQFFARKKPVYGLLAGDATYDYRDYLGLATAPGVPAFEVGHSLDPSGIGSREAFALDAWYADFEGEGGSPDMMLGRLTCRSGAELSAFVDKLVAYETAPAGLWNRRFLLLADDEWSGEPGRPDPIGFRHIEQCESMSALAGVTMDDVKVYLTEHPFAGVKNKPGARAELMRELQAGALVFFFFGHGDAFDLCHESVLNISQMADVTCGSRVPFSYFGSCSVGRFEDTRTECIAEELVRKPDGGSIVAVAATKATTSGSNSVFARNLLVPLFNSPDSTVGVAFFRAWATDRLYHLFGDPATRLRKLTGRDEELAVQPDTLRPASSFRARALLGASEGYCQWRLAGPERVRSYTSTRGTAVYALPGVTLARGNVAVRSGRLHFGGWFPLGVALDTVRVGNGSYRPVPRSGRVAAVVADGAGGFDIVGDTLAWDAEPAAAGDSAGPRVRFQVGGDELADGAVVPSEFEVEGVVEDPAGILVAPVPGWTPVFFAGRRSELVDLTDRLVFDDSLVTTARFRLPVRLSRGEDTLWALVSDNFLNRTLAGLAVRVLPATEALRLDSVQVYPNPVAGRAWFTFELNRPASVAVRVFTLAGRLVCDLGDRPAAFGYNQFEWDGRDTNGNPLANGVYLFTLTARAQGAAGAETARARDRLLVLR
jgi:hypothetical protein